MKKTARQLEAEIAAALKFPREPWEKKIDARKGKRVAMWIAALKKSPAVIVTDSYGNRDLVVRSGEMQNPGEGKLRATMFGTDGPRGHITRNTDRELAAELGDRYLVRSLRPASDAEVMKWTASSEFTEGSKRVAFTQAQNTLGFLASKTGRYDRAQEIRARADAAGDIEKATRIIEAGIKELRG